MNQDVDDAENILNFLWADLFEPNALVRAVQDWQRRFPLGERESGATGGAAWAEWSVETNWLAACALAREILAKVEGMDQAEGA